MGPKGYVLLLLEDSNFGNGGTRIGYWNGKKYWGEDVWYPGAIHDIDDEQVKVYKTKANAEKARLRLKDTFTYVSDAEIKSVY